MGLSVLSKGGSGAISWIFRNLKFDKNNIQMSLLLDREVGYESGCTPTHRYLP